MLKTFLDKKNGRTTTSKQSMKGDVLNDQIYGMECKSLMLDHKNQHNVLTQQHSSICMHMYKDYINK